MYLIITPLGGFAFIFKYVLPLISLFPFNQHNMKNVRLFFIVPLLLLVVIQLNAQEATLQLLNKEPFFSAASVLHDYDGDGDLDAIVSRGDPRGVYFLENDSTKQFPATPIITDDLLFTLADIDTADFDRDGDIDYVICFTRVSDGEMAWFQRQDDGTYIKWTIATNKDYIKAEVGDFDGDGWVDIAAVGLSNSDQTGRVYINQKNFFFEERIIAEGVFGNLDVGDLDDDGDLDIVFRGIGSYFPQNGSEDGSRTMINDGNGNFSLGQWLVFSSSGTGTTSLASTVRIIDFNQDGVNDILGFREWRDEVDYSFSMEQILQVPAKIGRYLESASEGFGDLGDHFVVFDVNEDGLLDIVRQRSSNDWLTILYQVGNFQFEREFLDLNWDTGGNPEAQMTIGDLDDDGDIDLLFPEAKDHIDEDISWYENIDGQVVQASNSWGMERQFEFPNW